MPREALFTVRRGLYARHLLTIYDGGLRLAPTGDLSGISESDRTGVPPPSAVGTPSNSPTMGVIMGFFEERNGGSVTTVRR